MDGEVMKAQQEVSSLPVLLVIAGAVSVSAVGGWFLLDRDTRAEPEQPETRVLAMRDAGRPEPAIEAPGADIDADLRKAQLAAGADNLVYPAERSALYYYGRILSTEPDHAVANAELDAVLSRVDQTIAAHLAASRYDDAYRMARLVAGVRPGHPLVHSVRQTLDDRAGELVELAMQHARDGNDAESRTALASAEALPGRQADYFAAVRDSIAEIQESRRIAEAERIEGARRREAAATQAWVDRVRTAIGEGRLISPEGESAREFLAERDTPAQQKAELTTELAAALVESGRLNIEFGELPLAETQLDAAGELEAEIDELPQIRESLEEAFVETESNRVVSTDQLERVTTVSPRYPKRAVERGITGWVEVMFKVTLDGETADIQVTRAEPEGIFNDAAIRAVEQWTFEPREFRGQIIEQLAATRLAFQLE